MPLSLASLVPGIVGCVWSTLAPQSYERLVVGPSWRDRADVARRWGTNLNAASNSTIGERLLSTRAYTPTAAVEVLRTLMRVIDELAALTAYADLDVRREATRLLTEILTQGRALGVVMVARVQAPRKDVAAMRGLFAQTVALRLRSAEETVMVLGDGMPHSAPAHRRPGPRRLLARPADLGALHPVRHPRPAARARRRAHHRSALADGVRRADRAWRALSVDVDSVPVRRRAGHQPPGRRPPVGRADDTASRPIRASGSRGAGLRDGQACAVGAIGVCGWLMRRGVIAVNPVRDLTPLELDRDRRARALSLEAPCSWLSVLYSEEFAHRHDLPELARFMVATGLRLGEALGVTWADVDLTTGTVEVRRTIVRVKGQGLVASRVKSRSSERTLLLPSWCVELLRARRVRMSGFEGPVFPSTVGGWRDGGNVGKAFRKIRKGSDFDLMCPLPRHFASSASGCMPLNSWSVGPQGIEP